MGPPTILVRWLTTLGNRHFPIYKEQLLDSVQQIMIKNKRQNPFTNDRPGKKWYQSFLKRHNEIVQRTCQNLTTSRDSVTQKDNLWFDEIKKYLEESNLMFILDDPKRIYNADESAFFLQPCAGHVLTRKGEKNVYSASGNEKENLTVLVTANAAGQLPPPMIVFSYERIPSNISNNVPRNMGNRKIKNRMNRRKKKNEEKKEKKILKEQSIAENNKLEIKKSKKAVISSSSESSSDVEYMESSSDLEKNDSDYEDLVPLEKVPIKKGQFVIVSFKAEKRMTTTKKFVSFVEEVDFTNDVKVTSMKAADNSYHLFYIVDTNTNYVIYELILGSIHEPSIVMRGERFSLAEALDIIYSDDVKGDIFVEPPAANIDTDEDSGNEDEGGPLEYLLANAEIRLPNNERLGIDYEENIVQPMQIIDEAFIVHLVEESRQYALFLNCLDPKVTADEIRCLIAILFVSEYNNLLSKRHYWDFNDDLKNIAVSQAMQRDSHEKIDGQLYVQWMDNEVMTMVSSSRGTQENSQVKRFSQQQKRNIMIPRQKLIAKYYTYMWHRSDGSKFELLPHWNTRPKLSQLEFKREVANVYLKIYQVQSERVGRPSASPGSTSDSRISDAIRFDRTDHLVKSIEKKEKVCPQNMQFNS
ncbi:hypothetical protein NQ314_014838 [Rhamnusium bicolor]|uniref:HTH CENPB-type domain-containing protein n=1 Tax=Rhamnusium bicolor TaxID=1586634 RepID=A0AAV8X0M0_9CUCU|nr:hypothetical protein NQ314_014838 [Rhamnusium bicolor]